MLYCAGTHRLERRRKQKRIEKNEARELFQAYVDGWVKADAAAILAAIDPACLVIESHGPTYYGRGMVERWVNEWFGSDGTVESWEVTSFYNDNGADTAFAEWDFTCVFAGERTRFAGATKLRFAGGRISEIHEYRMTGTPFDWVPGEIESG